ncbi:MAG: YHS domain-containing protein [Alphaproteobacteria bacterium]|nr:YHS domain-containing protein [Alphaproteobacteria bacterium]
MRIAIALVLAALAFAPLASVTMARSAFAAEDPVFATGGVAINGYDPVASFSDGKPVTGRAEFSHAWRGATWRFASAANRDQFAAAPERYAPQYGGFCAYGVTQGYAVKTEPDAWKIVDGKLYLNYDQSVQKRWSGDIPGYIAKADQRWPEVKKSKQ